MALLSVIVISILTFGGEYKIVCVPFAAIEIAIGMVINLLYKYSYKNSDKNKVTSKPIHKPRYAAFLCSWLLQL